jgi:hypothetical protein
MIVKPEKCSVCKEFLQLDKLKKRYFVALNKYFICKPCLMRRFKWESKMADQFWITMKEYPMLPEFRDKMSSYLPENIFDAFFKNLVHIIPYNWHEKSRGDVRSDWPED